MKTLKIAILIAAPLALAAMFGNAVYNISNACNLLDAGVNYIPLMGAFSFFAFFAFFVPTANLLFPDATVSINQETAQPVMTLQPCFMQVVKTAQYNSNLFNSLNIG